jgi:hypothetical protein
MLSPTVCGRAIWPVFCDLYWSEIENLPEPPCHPVCGADLCVITPRVYPGQWETLKSTGMYWAGMIHAYNGLDPWLLFYHMHNAGRRSPSWVCPTDDLLVEWLARCFLEMAGYGVSLCDDPETATALDLAWHTLKVRPVNPSCVEGRVAHGLDLPRVDGPSSLGHLVDAHVRRRVRHAENNQKRTKQ